MSAVIEMPAPKVELETRALTLADEARAVKVIDQRGLDIASSFVRDRIKPLIAEAHEKFDPICAANHTAWQVALKQRSSVIEPLEQAEKILKSAIGKFAREQEEKRQAEERRLREEEEKRLAEIREQEIEAAEKSGADPGLVEALCQEPLPAPMPIAAPTYRMPAGISTRETWSAQVVSMRDLCRAVADGKVPDSYVSANMTALNGRARCDKGLLNIPGVKAVRDTGVAARRG